MEDAASDSLMLILWRYLWCKCEELDSYVDLSFCTQPTFKADWLYQYLVGQMLHRKKSSIGQNGEIVWTRHRAISHTWLTSLMLWIIVYILSIFPSTLMNMTSLPRTGAAWPAGPNSHSNMIKSQLTQTFPRGRKVHSGLLSRSCEMKSLMASKPLINLPGS